MIPLPPLTGEVVAFVVCAPVMVLLAVGIVVARKPVHSAICMAGVMVGLAILYAAQDAPFLFVVQIIVYTGAILMLFLFVVMMLNIDVEEMRKGFWRNAPVAAVVGVLMAVALIMILVAPDTDLAAFGPMNDVPADHSNVRELGTQIYTTYLLPFELAAVLLVLGMVAAIALVHRKTFKPKYINPADQVKVDANKGRLRMVKMEAVVQRPSESEENNGEAAESDAAEGEGKA